MTEEIGKHKGAVETLLHEKKELSRILQIVNSQLKRHLSELEDAGIDTDEFINEIQQEGQQKQQQRQKRQETKQRSQQKEKDRDSREDIEDEDSGESSETPSSEREEDDEEDPGDLLEGGNDFSDRDFSPR